MESDTDNLIAPVSVIESLEENDLQFDINAT